MAASYETSTTKTPKKQKIRTVIRNEVEQKWLDSNTIPDKGELVYGSDVNTLKIGDGIHKYEDLPAISGGEQGTTDYNNLENKPSINSVTLVGNKTASDLGFAAVATSGLYNDLSGKPTIGNATITFTQGGVTKGSLTTNQTDNSTISLDITNVVDNVTTTSATDALSANMGKELQDEINNLKARGRYLSLWNCATGLPATNPTVSPYNYATGDYFIVGTVATSGQTNYRPDGSSYTIDVASTTVETNTVSPDDTYIYDGTRWILQYNTQKTVTFANIAGQPTDNSNLAAALNAKADAVDLATVATTGDYGDLLNKPIIPAAQVNSDWNAVSGVAEILNKPTLGTMAAENASDYTKTSGLATVATTGNYNDLINKPVTPTATDQVAGIAKLYNTTGQNTDGSMTQKSITDALDTQLANKVDKTSDVNKVYATDSTGAQTTIPYDKQNATALSIAQRDLQGQINIPLTPTANEHAASKKYVDDGLAEKVSINTAITGATKTKITYDSKGLVTAGADLVESDIPSLHLNKITDITATAAEINVLDGITATTTELNYVDGVTSSIQTQLNTKVNSTDLATVATSGSYDDLIDKPTIPAAQVNSDWNAVSGKAQILNKPSLATVATSGDYTDLSNKPTIYDLATGAQRSAIDSGATSVKIAQITTNQTDISTINGKIPSTASTSNQLADKAFVNSSIANMAANYVTSDAQGDNFATKAALLSGPYYYKGQVYTLTNNDYALVESDETKDNATTRYIYDGSQWNFQYIVNDTPFTQAQLDAINSTITSNLVSDYSDHIADTDIHVTAAQKIAWTNKQDALVSGTNIKTINSTSLLGSGDISIPILPSQSGHSGEFLTTNGTNASWTDLANVAISGEYTDLLNAPTDLSQFTDDTNFAAVLFRTWGVND